MPDNLTSLVAASIGEDATAKLMKSMAIAPALRVEGEDPGRSEIAMALNILLFHDLLGRVPTGAAYVAEIFASDGQLVLDHGALRTVRFGSGNTGALPGGISAFARILGPLGYVAADDYPLEALRMTGQAWRHLDLPADIPQFFVSELHVERFPTDFGAAARRVFGESRDPLDAAAADLLVELNQRGMLSLDQALTLLPVLVAAFGRQHQPCTTADYETLLAHSAEAAWIATEGNTFNHATDRVPNVEALAHRLTLEGRPMKPSVERSSSGRVRQTAFRADPVQRPFRDGSTTVMRSVPGSFYEFISRDIDPATGAIDLRFDSRNAQGIFAMTQAREAGARPEVVA